MPIAWHVGTRDEFLARLIQDQAEELQPGQHHWELQGYYIKCKECGCSHLKRSRMELLEAFLQKPCFHGPWQTPEGWQGHATHTMWRKHNVVSCKKCSARANLQKEAYTASQKLVKRCEKAEIRSLKTFFCVQDPE